MIVCIGLFYIYISSILFILSQGNIIAQYEHIDGYQHHIIITLSDEKDSYKVDIVIDRPCERDTLRKEHGSELLQRLMHELKLGPDEIYVQLEGATLQTHIARQDTECGKYQALIQVPFAGKYRLKVFRVRTGYGAVMEARKDFPKINYEVLCDGMVPDRVDETKPYCPKNFGYWVASADNTYFKGPVTVNPNRGLPLKTWVRTDKLQPVNPGEEPSCSKDIDLYRWNTDTCTKLNKDKKKALTVGPEVGRNLIVDKTIMFVGDSHMRGLADSFRFWLCHDHDPKDFVPLKVEGPDFQEIKITDGPCSGFTLRYLALVMCEKDIAHRMSNEDIIILNCGHHPGSGDKYNQGKGHYTLEKYENTVRKLFEELDSTLAEKKIHPLVLWLENSAQPLKQDDYVIKYGDWRTNHRLLLYHAIVNKELSKRNIPTVPAFHSTLAAFDKMCDMSHYPHLTKIPQLNGMLYYIYDRLVPKEALPSEESVK